MEVIRIQDLSYSYPDGRHALQGVSLVVDRGESVGLIGPNGAGKSTLLLHLNGILRQNGAVKVFGAPITEGNLREIRRRVGVVFQEPDDQLFSPTVFDDVAFGPLNMAYPASEVREAVMRALGWVGAAGYETRSPHHLSGGEKKRIALATVLSMDPDVLVIDEPTSNLDARGRQSIIELLRRLPVTRIIATHDLGLVRALCQRVVVLDDGRIVADGPVERILADTELLAAHGLAA